MVGEANDLDWESQMSRMPVVCADDRRAFQEIGCRWETHWIKSASHRNFVRQPVSSTTLDCADWRRTVLHISNSQQDILWTRRRSKFSCFFLRFLKIFESLYLVKAVDVLSPCLLVFTRATLASAGISCRRVCLSVCHKSVFYWNG